MVVVVIVNTIVNDDVACGGCANIDGGDMACNRGVCRLVGV
jgi:hypothetical protein